MHRDADRVWTFTRRAALLGGGQLALFSALAGRLYYLQVLNADQYALLADENRMYGRLPRCKRVSSSLTYAWSAAAMYPAC